MVLKIRHGHRAPQRFTYDPKLLSPDWPPDDDKPIKKEDNNIVDKLISNTDNLKRPRRVWVSDYLWEKIRSYGKQNDNISISEVIRQAVLEKLGK